MEMKKETQEFVATLWAEQQQPCVTHALSVDDFNRLPRPGYTLHDVEALLNILKVPQSRYRLERSETGGCNIIVPMEGAPLFRATLAAALGGCKNPLCGCKWCATHPEEVNDWKLKKIVAMRAHVLGLDKEFAPGGFKSFLLSLDYLLGFSGTCKPLVNEGWIKKFNL